MSLLKLHQIWDELAHDEHCQSLAEDLLSVRGTSMWLELLIDHPELLGSQLIFNENLARFMLLLDYSVEQRRCALFSLLFFAQEQPEHRLCQQLELQELAGLLLHALSFCDDAISESEERILNGIVLSTVLISAGSFEQGALPREPHTYDWEHPRHRVTLTQSIHMPVIL